MNSMYVECYQRWSAVHTSRPRCEPSEHNRRQRPTLVASPSEKPLRLQIQQARLRRRLTQAELAQSMSVPLSVVADFETGKTVPDGRQLRMLQDRLGGQLLGCGVARQSEAMPDTGVASHFDAP